MKRRVGIYTGTFDPIHEGHLAFSHAAFQQCALDKVVIIPETAPRGKPSVATLDSRLHLISEVIASYTHLETTSLTSLRFTVKETLPELRQAFIDADFTLLIGSDIIPTFLYRWEGLEELFTHTSLAIGMRRGDTMSEMQSIVSTLEKQYNLPINATFIETEHNSVSSSAIRRDRNLSR